MEAAVSGSDFAADRSEDESDGLAGGAGPRGVVGDALTVRVRRALAARSAARRALAGHAPPASGAPDPAQDARIEVLGDRIEMIEWTLNDYVERLDALSGHLGRISLDRLEPFVDRLASVVSAVAEPETAGTPDGRTEIADARGDAAAPRADDIVAGLAALRDSVDHLPDRIRISVAPPFRPGGFEHGTTARLTAAVSALARRQDLLMDALRDRLDGLEKRLDPLARAIADREERVAAEHPGLSGIAAALADMDARQRALGGALDARLGRLETTVAGVTADRSSPTDDITDAIALAETRLATRLDSALRRIEARLPPADAGPARDAAIDRLERKLAILLSRVDRAQVATAVHDMARRTERRGEDTAIMRILAALEELRAKSNASAVDAAGDALTTTAIRTALAELLADGYRRAAQSAGSGRSDGQPAARPKKS
jgi:hypothetical protein